jgi:gamma-glutamyltranspeptidase / glutathione hydrolase
VGSSGSTSTDWGSARCRAAGPLSVTVPGVVDGWFELHRRFGRLPMRDVLAPAIDYARSGFPVTGMIAAAWAAEAAVLADHPGFAAVFLPHDRAPPKATGSRILVSRRPTKRSRRTAPRRSIAGPIANDIAARMAAAGGFLTREDLAAHRSEWVDPVSTHYRGCTVFELPPNGQGIVVLQMLNLLEAYDLAACGRGSAEHVHLLVEAKKLAFEDRARYYADPDFAAAPVAALVSKDYARERRRLIDPARAARQPGAGDPRAFEGGDTIYLAAADADGLMVSLIQSNFRGFGSGVTVPEYGFVLHNRGELFALEPGHANAYEPGKRPFHTIIPAFAARDGEWLMSFGVMGADMQPQGHVQILTNIIDFHLNVQEAGDVPRVRHEGSTSSTGGEPMHDGGVVHLEPGFAPETLGGLRSRGHRIEPADGGFGGYQAILRDLRRGVYWGASESRKDGQAAGF